MRTGGLSEPVDSALTPDPDGCCAIAPWLETDGHDGVTWR